MAQGSSGLQSSPLRPGDERFLEVRLPAHRVRSAQHRVLFLRPQGRKLSRDHRPHRFEEIGGILVEGEEGDPGGVVQVLVEHALDAAPGEQVREGPGIPAAAEDEELHEQPS